MIITKKKFEDGFDGYYEMKCWHFDPAISFSAQTHKQRCASRSLSHPNRITLPDPSVQMLSYSEGVPSEQTKHTCPDPSGTTQDFFYILYWL